MILKYMLYSFLIYLLILPAIAENAGQTHSDTLDQATLTFIRYGFYESVESHAQTNRMIEFIESKYSDEYMYDEPVLLAYYGVLNALKAKHVFNPFSKISYLRSALRKLDEAAIEGACNLEVRFLRFSVLHNIPSFLGFGDKLREDANAVFELLIVDEKYTDLNPDLALNVVEFMIESKRLNDNQQNEMELLAQRLKADEQLSFD